jgi:hypothetical protein
VAKKDERVARVSGGAAGMLSSTYVCRVFGGIEVTSECRASGVGGTTCFDVSAEGLRGAIVMFGCEPSPLNAASEGEGVRSCWGAESTAIGSD